VRAQQQTDVVRDAVRTAPKRVVHVPRGVIGRNVEALKVVGVELDFRTVEDLIAHRGKDVLELARHERDRMQTAGDGARAG
jgi:hypothetical protein